MACMPGAQIRITSWQLVLLVEMKLTVFVMLRKPALENPRRAPAMPSRPVAQNVATPPLYVKRMQRVMERPRYAQQRILLNPLGRFVELPLMCVIPKKYVMELQPFAQSIWFCLVELLVSLDHVPIRQHVMEHPPLAFLLPCLQEPDAKMAAMDLSVSVMGPMRNARVKNEISSPHRTLDSMLIYPTFLYTCLMFSSLRNRAYS